MSNADRNEPRRWVRIALVLAASSAVALVCFEVGLRWLLFGQSRLALRLGDRLRDPALYCSGYQSADYWKIQYLCLDHSQVRGASRPDPRVGWTSPDVTPGSYAHVDEAKIGGRIPVLLYGDSFAQGNTQGFQCFQSLLEDSDLGARYCMLNYGVGGYGLDQIYLMLASSIDRFRERDPIVIVGILVDDDLDRSVLAFRNWPKPRLRIVDDRLVEDGPVDTDADGFLAANPPRIASYAWRLLAYRRGLLPTALQARMRSDEPPASDLRELNARILGEIHALLAARGVRHSVFLFHGQASFTEKNTRTWQEPLIASACSASGMRASASRPYLLAACGDDLANLGRFFGNRRGMFGHYNALGNAVVFEGLRGAIDGRADDVGLARIRELVAHKRVQELATRVLARELVGRQARISVRAEDAVVRFSRSRAPPFDAWDDQERLLVRAGEYGPTEIEFELGSDATRFSGVARCALQVDRPCEYAPTELSIEADGRVLFRERIGVSAPGTPIALDLSGVQRLVLRVSTERARDSCTWVCIQSPTLR